MQEQNAKQGDSSQGSRDVRDRPIEETTTGTDPGGNPPPSGNPPKPPFEGPQGGGGKPGRG